MRTPTHKTWLLAAALMVVGAQAGAADWGLFIVPPNAPRPEAANVSKPVARTHQDKQPVDCVGTGGNIRGRAPQRASAKILAAAKSVPQSSTPTPEERVAEADRIAAQHGVGRADKLASAAFAAAAQCRDFAQFKKAKMGLSKKKIYNSCKIFGAQNAYRSKGLCSAGVREAFEQIGVKLNRSAAKDKRPILLKNGFQKVAYNPWDARNGTVLVCNGGHSRCGGTKKHPIACGHIEIVVVRDGERNFCSDFCSTTPTCSRGSYTNPTAFALPGI